MPRVEVGDPPVRSSRFGGVKDTADIAQEEEIVWLDDPAKYEYLRERFESLESPRTRPPSMAPCRIVAYAKLRRGAVKLHGRQWFDRRVWYINPRNDPYAEHKPETAPGWPIEAVWPGSIKAGQLSEGPTDAQHRAADPRYAELDKS